MGLDHPPSHAPPTRTNVFRADVEVDASEGLRPPEAFVEGPQSSDG